MLHVLTFSPSTGLSWTVVFTGDPGCLMNAFRENLLPFVYIKAVVLHEEKTDWIAWNVRLILASDSLNWVKMVTFCGSSSTISKRFRNQMWQLKLAVLRWRLQSDSSFLHRVRLWEKVSENHLHFFSLPLFLRVAGEGERNELYAATKAKVHPKLLLHKGRHEAFVFIFCLYLSVFGAWRHCESAWNHGSNRFLCLTELRSKLHVMFHHKWAI